MSDGFTVEEVHEAAAWDAVALAAGAHPLQLWGWGEAKARHGWTAHRLVLRNGGQAATAGGDTAGGDATDGAAGGGGKAGDDVVGGAQVLVRRLPATLKALAYVPRGPFLAGEQPSDREPATDDRRQAALSAVADWCRAHVGGVGVTVEPDWEEREPPVAWPPGWRPSPNPVLYPHTLVLDLTRTEDELLGAMTKKTRQYIRKSEREAVTTHRVTTLDELHACLEVYRVTARRAGFALHSAAYYEDVFAALGEHSPVFATVDDDGPVAFLWLAASRTTAFELYGGMTDRGQQLRANYTLKWHAITAMKAAGVRRYDLNGLLNDGISTFKRGFASHETTLVGSADLPLSLWYPVWTRGLPTAKRVLRALPGRG